MTKSSLRRKKRARGYSNGFVDVDMADPAPVHELIRLVEPAQPDWHQLEEQFPDCPVTTELSYGFVKLNKNLAITSRRKKHWWLSSIDMNKPTTQPPPINIGLKPFGYGTQQGYQYWLFIEPVGRVAMRRQLEFRLSQLKRQRLSVNSSHELIHLPALNSLLSLSNYSQWTVVIWLKHQQDKR